MTPLLSLLPLVLGDIPVHCLIADFSGSWVLHLSNPVGAGVGAPGVPEFDKTEGITQDYCFSGHPNTNGRNVNLDVEKEFKDNKIETHPMYVEMTQNISMREDGSEHLVADVADPFPPVAPMEGMAASWTTTYDEGWELRVGPEYRFFALAKYSCAKEDGCGQNGVGEDSHGLTEGYKSSCGKTLVGWFHTPAGKGCFYGTKADEKEAKKVHSYVMEERQASLKVHTAYHHSDFSDFSALPSFLQVLDHHKHGGSKDFQTTRRAGSIRRHAVGAVGRMRIRDQCQGDDVVMADRIEGFEAEHKTFDWRQQFDNKWNTPVVDQGGCGSCYAIAMTYTLQSRANIMRLQELEKKGLKGQSLLEAAPEPVALSAHSSLACSYYNQGCDGGYPYLIAKHAMDFGIPQEQCQPYGSASEGTVQACDGHCFQDESKVVFADNYNYVGGFYGVCGQYHMMKSLVEKGPLVVALEVPMPFNSAMPDHVVGTSYLDEQLRRDRQDGDKEQRAPEDHSRRDPLGTVKMLEARWSLKDSDECTSKAPKGAGLLALETGELAKAFVARSDSRFALNSDELSNADPHGTAQKELAAALGVPKECVDLQMADGTMNGWEYTNHAITLVGWGEHKKSGENGPEIVKYWIIRNSWGPDFGDEGYAYVLRGHDYAGIESQAVDVTVDRSRGLMKAFLGGSLLETSAKAQTSPQTSSVAVDAQGNLQFAEVRPHRQ